MQKSNLVRKDCESDKTIKRILKILEENELELKIVKEVDNGMFHSCRIELDKLPYGTNGKSITREYSLASGYGEFMERYQTGCLFDFMTFFNETNLNLRLAKEQEVISQLKKIFNNCYDFNSDFEFIDICKELPFLLKVDNYYNVNDRKFEELPDSFLWALCGSNGLCAGNTPYEALSQGVAEIFERIAMKKIYYNNYFPITIPEEYLCKLQSYHMLELIREHNYIYLVKDLTLGGKVPVVGLIIIDPARHRCQMSAGSDLNFDIALQRCITELFQGKKFDLAFPLYMNPIIDFDILDSGTRSKIRDNYISEQYQRQVSSGDGILPLSCFMSNQKFNENNLDVFINDEISNEDVWKNMLKIVFDNNYTIFIKNLSVAGFPTYRVFISNESNINDSLKMSCESIILKAKIEKMLHENKLEHKKMLELIQKINEQGVISSKINISIMKGNAYTSEVLQDTKLIEVYLLMKLNRYNEASVKYSNYFANNSECDYVALYINAFSQKKQEEVIEFLKNINNQKALSEIGKFMDMFDELESQIMCNECNTCKKNNICLHNEKKEFIDKFVNLQNCFHANKESYDLICSAI